MKIKGKNSIVEKPGMPSDFAVINHTVSSMFINSQNGQSITPVAIEADVSMGQKQSPRPESTMKPRMR